MLLNLFIMLMLVSGSANAGMSSVFGKSSSNDSDSAAAAQSNSGSSSLFRSNPAPQAEEKAEAEKIETKEKAETKEKVETEKKTETPRETTSSSRAAGVFGGTRVEERGPGRSRVESSDDSSSEVRASSSASSSSRATSVFGKTRGSSSSQGGSSSRATSVFGGRSSGGRYADASGAQKADAGEKEVTEVREEDLKEDYSGKEFLWPVEKGTLTSFYGWRSSSRFHDGIDIGAPSGTKIFAVKSGKVMYSDHKISGYGNMIVVKHNGNIFSVYAHNKVNKVSRGDTVSKGDVIGLVGNSGKSHGPHLHFEIRKGKYSTDPMKYYSYKLSKKKGFVHEFK
jgi:murein DD-endopeptidase MepM/ murein hydrolase activator NlpD